MPVVDILRCADGSLYVGHTLDLPARVRAHNDGEAALYTRKRRPLVVVFSEVQASLVDAVRRERQLKRWTRAKKEALIAGDRQRLKRL